MMSQYRNLNPPLSPSFSTLVYHIAMHIALKYRYCCTVCGLKLPTSYQRKRVKDTKKCCVWMCKGTAIPLQAWTGP
jgi:hypothetical protein